MGGDGRDEHPSDSKRNALQQDDVVFEQDESHEEAPNTTTSRGKPKAVPRHRHKKSVKDSFPGKRVIIQGYSRAMILVTATMKPIRDCLKLMAPQTLGNFALSMSCPIVVPDEMRQFARQSLEEQIQKIQDKMDENSD